MNPFWSLLKQPGTLVFTGKLPPVGHASPRAVQPGSHLDFTYPPEEVTLVFEGSEALAERRQGVTGTGATPPRGGMTLSWQLHEPGSSRSQMR
ncbi:MAG: hypothetical protein U1D30_07125 [Planctomycetota bacterium]